MEKPIVAPLHEGSKASTEDSLIHVLYVDDETGLLKAAKPILEMQGAFTVETASSVEEAKKRMQQETFDVIISDYIMPGKDGLEFLMELREGGNSIPFILFTGKGREIVAIKALNLGADQYVNKIGKTEAVYSELAHGIRAVVKAKKAEEALRDIEKEKSAVLDGMSELVVHQDLKHRILWANRKAADSVKLKVEQLRGRYCYELWGNSAKPCTGCPIEDAIKTGQPQQGEITTPDGRVWSIKGSPIIDANGDLASIVEVATNITEQKKAEEAVEKERQELDRILDSSPIIVFYKDNNGKLLRVNKAFAEALKLSKEEFLGKTVFDLYSPEIAQSMTKDDKEVLESGCPTLGIVESYESAGGIRWVQTDKIPILDEMGSPIGLVGFAQDITERKKTEEALQESEERYRSMLEQAPDLIVTVDEKGIVTSCNAVLEKNTDFSQNEVVGKHFLNAPFLHEIDPDTAQKVFNSILEGKHPERIEIKWFLKDGTPHISELRIGLNKKDGKIAGFTAVARDITDYKKAEEKLMESEEKFRNLAEKSPNMIFINKKGRVVYANNRCEEIMGYTKEEFYSPDFNFFTLIAPESIEMLKSSYSNHLEGEEILPYEYTLITNEGKRIEAILTSKLITYERETAILGIVTDISERKQAEEALKRSEGKYRSLFTNLLNGFAYCKIILDDKGKPVDWVYLEINDAFEKITGLKRENVVGKKISEALPRTIEDHPELFEIYGRVALTQKEERFDIHFKPLDIGLHISVYSPRKGYFVAVFEDITKRKKVEAELRREKELMEMVTTNNAAGLAIISKDFRVLWANRHLTEQVGDIRGKVCYSKLSNMTDVCPGCGVKEILETGKNKVVHEQVVQNANGQTVWLEITAIPVRDENGNLIAVSELSIDITDRKKAEEALRESEKRFRELSELLPEVIFETDSAGLLTFVNNAAFERFGYSQKDFDKGLNALEMVVPEERNKAKENMVRILRGKKMRPNEYMGIRKDGTTFPFIINTSPIMHENKPVGMRGLIMNIEELKKAEEALRKSEEKYRETIVNSNVGIICNGPEGEVKILNPKMEQMTGFSISEVPTLQDWFEKVYPNEKERHKIMAKWFKRMSEEGEVKEGHATITTKDDRQRNLLFNSVRLQSGDSITFAIDITESNAAWESLDETINALMSINEKLNVIGRLTRHDVRNKLTVIANNAYLAKQTLATNPNSLEYLDAIELGVDQIEKICDFARTYEMLGVEELSYIDVEKNIDEAAMLFSEFSTIKLVNECKGLTVFADSLLRQLIYNLIDNTLKYGKKVTQIRVYYEEETEQLKLVYEDDGVGVPENEKNKIFKEGYGKGTGYGLYLIRKICENYGWTIQETGVPGKGAQFTMTIPKTDANGKTSYTIS